MDFSALNDVGQAIIGAVEVVVSLSAVHAVVSVITVFIAVWVMQATTQGAGLGSRRARLLLAQRVTIGSLAVALAFNAATPFITPDPPWLSDVPVVFAIMMLLIIIGLLHRSQSEPTEGE
ncbi:MAG: hypothetical protein R3D62_14975 [Xanthobacteraceae bacterium]